MYFVPHIGTNFGVRLVWASILSANQRVSPRVRSVDTFPRTLASSRPARPAGARISLEARKIDGQTLLSPGPAPPRYFRAMTTH